MEDRENIESRVKKKIYSMPPLYQEANTVACANR